MRVATQLAEMFATDIDFHRELRSGDTFSRRLRSAHRRRRADHLGSGAGRVLAAEFVNNGQTYSAVWFKDARRQGRLLRLRRPEQAARVPRQPDGVLARDLGLRDAHAPDPEQLEAAQRASTTARRAGTPVRTVGDGIVEFAGWQNGYGNVVQIRHGNERSTSTRT